MDRRDSDRKMPVKATSVSDLQACKALLHSVLERSPDAFVIVDQQGIIQFANHAAGIMFGTTHEDLVGRPFGIPLSVGQTTDVDLVGSNGAEQVAEMRVVETEWNGATAKIAVLRDITERSRVERSRKENEKRLALALDAARLGFWDIDLRSDRMICNDKIYECLGYGSGYHMPQCSELWKLVHPEDDPRLQKAFSDHLQGKTPNFKLEMRLRAKSGEWRWMLFQGEVVERDYDDAPARVIGVAENIHERKVIEERVRHASQHDVLTDLPNRSLLYEFAAHLISGAQRSGARHAFLFVDLDRFKPINDTYGHDVGDAVLKEVANRLGSAVRSQDVVGRLGGDEFLLILVNIHTESDAGKVARALVSKLGEPFQIEGRALKITPSIGISVFPQDGESVDDLIRNADLAMYQAKQYGRNQTQFFKPEFNHRAADALRIETLLRHGIEKEEFELFYQPILDIDSEYIVSAEALIRWPGREWQPAQFIPVAEVAGVMQSLGAWVIREVCRQQRAWRDKGFDLFPVAVNVSPTQFRQKGFVQFIEESLQNDGISASELYLEVTESTLMQNVEDAADILHALRNKGIKVALDDFGTGYSSLSYLSQLPIDILKVDQSFIRGIEHSKANVAITEGIIALGRSLGLDIIAEGIESEKALNFLKAKQRVRGQGYRFCRPMPVPEFEQWCWKEVH